MVSSRLGGAHIPNLSGQLVEKLVSARPRPNATVLCKVWFFGFATETLHAVGPVLGGLRTIAGKDGADSIRG
eukprot:5832354-Amphidinium_carterae.1